MNFKGISEDGYDRSRLAQCIFEQSTKEAYNVKTFFGQVRNVNVIIHNIHPISPFMNSFSSDSADINQNERKYEILSDDGVFRK